MDRGSVLRWFERWIKVRSGGVLKEMDRGKDIGRDKERAQGFEVM